MKQIIMNRFSILAIVVVFGLSVMTACTASSKNGSNSSGENSASGTAHQMAENKQSNSAETTTATPVKQADIFAAFKKGADYQKVVRPKILADGWQAAPEKDSDLCGSGDDTCDKFPELNHCAGTGLGNCEFRWQKDGRILLVYTVDDPQVYDSYKLEKSSKQSGESQSNDSEVIGKYVYSFTDEGGGEVSFDIQNDKVAVFKTYADELVEEGQGSWNWDNAKGLLTVNLPSVRSVSAEDETKPTYSKRTIVLKRVGKNFTIAKIIPASAGGTGGTFKKV